MKDLIGKKFGQLTVLEYVSRNNKKKHNWWKCKCDCGKEREFEQWRLINATRSCGCVRHHRVDLTNERFGKLIVIGFDHFKKWSGTYWKCRCDCGNDCLVRSNNLRSGWTTSCGCIRNIHGKDRVGFKGYKDISGTEFTRIRTNAERRSINFDLDIEYLWGLFTEQKGKCALSGLDIHFPKHSRERDITASLDRIDSSKEYTRDNVQWLHKDINFMKQSLSQDRFIELCRTVIKHVDEKVKS